MPENQKKPIKSQKKQAKFNTEQNNEQILKVNLKTLKELESRKIFE